MSVLKKLDRFVLKKFLLLFAGSFCVCLFVFMMQFTWRYLDDLIGKGLTLDILIQFFWYMGMTLVPNSLPLAVLLASLITFANMAESLELLSIRAAGVSLLRIMAPMATFCTMLIGVSFYFQNKTSPESQMALHQLLISMKQTSPAVEIPEGVFYSGVPNVNLYVQRKVPETGMLYQVIIYKTDQGFERAQIVLADSARMVMSADKMHMMLDLWSGEQFENLQGGNSQALGNVPYDRETFQYKRFIIDFDANFNLMEADMLRNLASAKSEQKIMADIDSMRCVIDSMGRANYAETMAYRLALTDSTGLTQQAATDAARLKDGFDGLVASLPDSKRAQAMQMVSNAAQALRTDYEWRKSATGDVEYFIRLHLIEWHQKITISLACLLFFFIGAPLGSVIGKGGMGMSAVVSVLIFVLYYLVNTSGMKMGRQGDIPVWLGMWASTFIMLPCGIWITYKCHLDRLNINFTSIWNKITQLPVWRQFRRLWKTLSRGGWSS